MKKRPFFNNSIADLENIFSENKEDLDKCSLLLLELQHRTTKRASLLKGKVSERINILETNNPLKGKKDNLIEFSCSICNFINNFDTIVSIDFFTCNNCSTIFKSQKLKDGNYVFSPMIENDNVEFDPYEILGISKDASIIEIKDAYRLKMREYHPDKVAHLGIELQKIAERMTKMINNAYDFLK